MKDYVLSALVTIYEKGQELKPDMMSSSEVTSIVECVDELFKNYGSKVFFDTDATEDEEGNTILLVHCYHETEDGRDSYPIVFPREWVTKTVAMANGKSFNLIGDKIPIAPRNGSWNFVEVKLTNYDE